MVLVYISTEIDTKVTDAGGDVKETQATSWRISGDVQEGVSGILDSSEDVKMFISPD